jgi:hypothetical protein
MRKDQRPWIRVDLDGSYIQPNSEMFAIVHLLNRGKTPARRVLGDLFVERVKSGEQPKLDSPNPHERISEGIQFPDIPSQSIAINRVHSLEAGQVDPAPISDAEFKEWFNGATYFVVYGTIFYSDYYNVTHWTKFCVPLVTANGDTKPKWIPFRKCTDYADVDGN